MKGSGALYQACRKSGFHRPGPEQPSIRVSSRAEGAFGSATGTINFHSIVSTDLDELMNLQRSLAETTPEAKKTSNTPRVCTSSAKLHAAATPDRTGHGAAHLHCCGAETLHAGHILMDAATQKCSIRTFCGKGYDGKRSC